MSDILIKQISNLSLKLVTEFETSQSEIHQKISDLLLEKGKKLVPLQVAVNSGGEYFDYSDHFLRFILEIEPGDGENDLITYTDKMARVEIVPYIKDFGRITSEKYPGLLEIIMLYLQADFHRLGDYIVKLNSLWNQKEILSQNLEMLTDHIDNIQLFGNGIDKIDINTKIQGSQLGKYSRIHLEKTEKTIKEVLEANKSEISQAEVHANEIPLDFLADIIEKIETKLPEELEIERRLIEIERYKKLKRMDFLRNVELSGSESWNIWYSQKHIQPRIAIYLTKNRKYVEKFVNVSRKPHHILEAQTLLGLISASNTNCTLKIVEIPQLVEWKLESSGKYEKVILC